MTATALEPAAPRAASGLRCAIHQPNVLPHLGFFAKCMQADVLVLLDDVPFSRGSYTNRVRVMGPKGPTWLTVPVAHPCSGVAIRDVAVAGPYGAAADLLDAWYPAKVWHEDAAVTRDRLIDKRMRSVTRLDGPVCGGYTPNWDGLCWRNFCGIEELLYRLRLAPPFSFKFASRLRATPEPGTSGLIQLCKAVGATTYVAGNGTPYDDVAAYAAAGIEFTRAQFRHPEYPQRRPAGMEFVPGLSVVDVLANVGVEETRRLLGESISQRRAA